MKGEISIARRSDVMKTAIKFSLIVGPVLILINHGDMLLSERHITVATWLKMGLTMIVPYVVSTLSSVSACKRRCKRHDDVVPPTS